MPTRTLPVHKIEEMEQTFPELEHAASYTLADAIRDAATVVEQHHGDWVSGERVCALSAAALAARARHMI